MEGDKDGRAYYIALIHAEDDADIPCNHSDVVFWHAVNATVPGGISYQQLETEKETKKIGLGQGGLDDRLEDSDGSYKGD